MTLTLHPRLRLDIGWRDLFSALAPVSEDPRPAIAALWPRPAHVFLSVRTAFDALLQTLDLREGDEIVLSAVNIESMAEVARAHGLKLAPVDIDVRTLAPAPEAVRAAMTERTRIILIAHLFGARLSLAPYAELRGPGCLLVEDCAQAWGENFRGNAEADVSLFSFGPIKRRTALGGAVAVFRDETLMRACGAIEAGYAPMEESWFLRRVAKYAALKIASAPIVYSGVHALVQAITGDAEGAIGAAARGFGAGDLIAKLRRRPPRRMLRLLLRQLTKAHDDNARIAATKDVLGRVAPQMNGVGADVRDHSYWLAPILVRDPAAAPAVLKRYGFDVTRGATSLRALETAERAAPNARGLIERVLYLPPPWKLNAAQRAILARELLRVCDPPG